MTPVAMKMPARPKFSISDPRQTPKHRELVERYNAITHDLRAAEEEARKVSGQHQTTYDQWLEQRAEAIAAGLPEPAPPPMPDRLSAMEDRIKVLTRAQQLAVKGLRENLADAANRALVDTLSQRQDMARAIHEKLGELVDVMAAFQAMQSRLEAVELHTDPDFWRLPTPTAAVRQQADDYRKWCVDFLGFDPAS